MDRPFAVQELDISSYDDIISVWKQCGLPLKPMGRDSRESIDEQIRSGRCRFIGANLDDKLVGIVLATHDGRKGWINRLAVLPYHRTKGIARMLVSSAEKWLKDQGIGIFACLIEGYNSTSFEVFERLGYMEFEGVKYFTKRLREDI